MSIVVFILLGLTAGYVALGIFKSTGKDVVLDFALGATGAAIAGSTFSHFAATQFLHMVVALPQRRIMGLGVPMTPSELDAWAEDAVNLFLNGCRGLSSVSSRHRR